MSAHAPHESLRGYSPDQILCDDCPECENRCMSRDLGLSSLDSRRYEKAWERAVKWNRGEMDDRVSNCEAPLLSVLWAEAVQWEKRGIPLTGRCPSVWDFSREPAL